MTAEEAARWLDELRECAEIAEPSPEYLAAMVTARERAARVEALRGAEHALRKAAEATRGIAHPEYTRATLDDVALLDGHAEIEGRDSIAARAEEEEKG